jgi:uncharacterized protein (TIGR03546 family)
MIILKIVSNFIKAFRSGESPRQIALGFCFGFLLGLMPFWTVQGFLVFLILFFVNINLSAGTVATLLASALAYLIDPVFHAIGFFVLTQINALQSFWEWLYNTPLGPLSRFNNTVVMGSFVGGLLLCFPIYWGMAKLVVNYRTGFAARIKKYKLVQLTSGSKLFQWYEKVRDLGGE